MPLGHEVRVAYSDLTGVEVAHYLRLREVVLTFKDGHKDSFDIRHGQWVARDEAQAAADFLKSKLPAASP